MKSKSPNGIRMALAALCLLGMLSLPQSAALTVYAQGDAELTASAAVVEGNTAKVTVTLKNNPGIWGLKFKAYYDHSALTLRSAENGNMFGGSDVTPPSSLEREAFVFVAASNSLADIARDGTVTTLVFSVKDAAAAKTYPVTLEPVQAINAAGEYIDIRAAVGEDTIQIRGLLASYPYTGAKITPAFDVVDNSLAADGEPKVLLPGIDYTVKYANNLKENATATVTVTGKGNYKGQDVKGSFKIEAAKDASVAGALIDLKGAKLSAIAPQSYTGKALYPDLKLTLKDKSSVEYTHAGGGVYEKKAGGPMDVKVALSNNKNRGTASILLTGATDAKGRPTAVRKTFQISPVDLSKAKDKLAVSVAGVPVTRGTASATYAVKGVAPKIEISYDSGGDKLKLVNGRDYTLTFSSNKKAGTAKFTVTGKGNYAKRYTGPNTFSITPLDMAKTKLAAVTAYDGLGSRQVKATVLDPNGDLLGASQYTVKVYKDGKEYRGRLKAGDTILVKAVAKDVKNLKAGTETASVACKAGRNIASANISFYSKVYTGSKITLQEGDLKSATIRVKGKTIPLKLKPAGASSGKGYDFEIVSYSNNVSKGTASAVIRGLGDYSGTKTVRFSITAKPMKLKKLLADILEKLR